MAKPTRVQYALTALQTAFTLALPILRTTFLPLTFQSLGNIYPDIDDICGTLPCPPIINIFSAFLSRINTLMTWMLINIIAGWVPYLLGALWCGPAPNLDEKEDHKRTSLLFYGWLLAHSLVNCVSAIVFNSVVLSNLIDFEGPLSSVQRYQIAIFHAEVDMLWLFSLVTIGGEATGILYTLINAARSFIGRKNAFFTTFGPAYDEAEDRAAAPLLSSAPCRPGV